jgi:hypothetical protein
MPPFRARDDDWVVQIGDEELRIGKGCTASFPCFHYNSMELSSVEIWKILEARPYLQYRSDRVWHHFRRYTGAKQDDSDAED